MEPKMTDIKDQLKTKEPRAMKDKIFIGIGFWVFINLAIIIAIVPTTLAMDKCNTDFNRRIEYIFPGHVVGCWLSMNIDKGAKGDE